MADTPTFWRMIVQADQDFEFKSKWKPYDADDVASCTRWLSHYFFGDERVAASHIELEQEHGGTLFVARSRVIGVEIQLTSAEAHELQDVTD